MTATIDQPSAFMQMIQHRLTSEEQMYGPPTIPTSHDQWEAFMRQSIPTPDHVYRRRRLVLLLIVSALVLLGVLIAEGKIHNEPPPTNSPDIMEDIGTALTIERPTLSCPAEDEVIVETIDNSFGHRSGELHCTHIDNIGGPS